MAGAGEEMDGSGEVFMIAEKRGRGREMRGYYLWCVERLAEAIVACPLNSDGLREPRGGSWGCSEDQEEIIINGVPCKFVGDQTAETDSKY